MYSNTIGRNQNILKWKQLLILKFCRQQCSFTSDTKISYNWKVQPLLYTSKLDMKFYQYNANCDCVYNCDLLQKYASLKSRLIPPNYGDTKTTKHAF